MNGCVSPAQRIDIEAEQYGFSKQVVNSKQFAHVIYIKQGKRLLSSLHVYLEGDGSPWIRNRKISTDPTSRDALVLRLMELDDAPSIYLGRPCYHGMAEEPPCKPWLWTHGRYSTTVLDSMEHVLKRIIERSEYADVTLIGHSGGGTLAMLLAERVPETRVVVTVAGNLDPDTWTEHHGFSSLNGSLNPVDRPPLHRIIHQYHLAAEEDEIIPSWITRQALSQRADVELAFFEGFDHTCCWQRIWSDVLDCIESRCMLSEYF